ncbi:hypothetical protein [Chitinimonas arctica]|uniref:hypothetical protein n=1 Tax=Chitinimonas arctica TaxID=2594795 RepID=UPI0015D406F9|nr:hypothetical protein [Chitinimonas arctica]
MQRDQINTLFETTLLLGVAVLFAGALLGALKTPGHAEQPSLAKHTATQVAQSENGRQS